MKFEEKIKRKDNLKVKSPTIINIYNFIRKTVYPSGEFVQDDFETVLYQIELLKQYHLPATYALKYDALIDERFNKLIKENVDEYDEVAVWWEIDKQLAEKANVLWKGKTPVDDHVNIGYSLGYSPEDRIKMVDVYMKDFKSIFGYYPKTVGSWVVDIVTLKYMKEKYGVIGAVLCRDQIGTDGFTLWGGYYNQGYYPSKINEYIPAQCEDMQVKLPIFRMLGPDPIYAFEDGLRKDVSEVYTLEPASVIGKNEKWIEWYFDRLTNEDNLGFSYAQTGQENTFLWNTMYKGYEKQVEIISKLEKEKVIRVETLEESSTWFENRYKLTPPTTFIASKDWNEKNNLKTLWYNSRFYRISFLLEEDILSIRDVHLFDERYKSRYYENTLEESESIFDALPILNSHYWSNEFKRASIDFRKINKDESSEFLKCENLFFKAIDDATYKLSCKVEGEAFDIICEEDNIKVKYNNVSSVKWEININMMPVLMKLEDKKIICSHNDFAYSLKLNHGIFKKNEDGSVSILPEKDFIEICTNNIDEYIKCDFFQKSYLANKESIDNFIPKYKQIVSESKVKPRAFKPIVNRKAILSQRPINEKIEIKNPNIDSNIYYTLDGSEPNEKSFIYDKPIIINDTCIVKAVAIKEGYKPSETIEVEIFASEPIRDIKGFTNPTKVKKYNKNGVYDLIDGKKGTKDYTDGSWLGYTEDLDVVVDLGEIKEIKNIMIGFLQDTRAWIYFPQYITFEISKNGLDYKPLGEVKELQSVPRREVEVKNIKVNSNESFRYLRVFAKGEGDCPKWSIMAGEGPAFMFVDQITID